MQDLALREGKQVRVVQKVVEGKRERNVPFVGLILRVRGQGINKMITVRQNLEGIDVERIFPISSPTITKIELVEEKARKAGGKKKKKSSR